MFSSNVAGFEGPALFRHACAMGLKGDRLEAARHAVSVGPVDQLAEDQVPRYRRPGVE
jgi:hypothetical protein